MITVILICYLGCVYVAFKVVKLKVNPVSVAVAALIGVVLIGGIVIGWKLSAPMTEKMLVNRPVVPLVASENTKELIKKIHVKRDQRVKKGDLLYEVETTPFEYALEQQAATLDASKAKVQAMLANLDVSAAQLDQAKAALTAAKADMDTAVGMQRDDAGAVSKLKVEVERLSYVSAQAAVEVAAASRSIAEFDLATARDGVTEAQAKLQTAQLDLDRAHTRAPADGRLINWQATEGTMTTTVITSAQGTFEDLTVTRVLAVFRQNLLKNVAAGDRVEVAFKSFPRHIATGTVSAVLEYTGEGQFETTGVLPQASSVGSKGFLVVRVLLDDENFARELPLGAAGTTAIYAGVGKPFHVITKIALRMKAWMYYLPI